MPSSSGENHGRLIEREAVRDLVHDVLTVARGGSGGVLLIEGAAGEGKTSLLAAIAREARQSFLVRTAQGTELEQALGWGVARELLVPPVLGRADPDMLPAAAAALGLAGAPGHAPDPLVACYALTDLCSELSATTPLLLVVDDAQWADALSARWLAHLAPRVAEVPLVVVIAARPADPRRPAELTVLGGYDTVQVHRLTPLSPTGTADLVRRTLATADDALCEACYRASGGNAFLVVELARELQKQPAEATPERVVEVAVDRIDRVVARRLAAAGGHAAALAKAASVCGPHAARADVAVVAGLDAAVAADAADLLQGVGLLDPSAPGFAFAHPLLRSAVERGIPGGERTRLHLRAAHELARQGEPVDRVAGHLLVAEAGNDPWVRDQLRCAGDEAVAAGAPRDAMRLYQRALAERVGPDAALLVRLGAAASGLDPAAAEAPLQSALRMTPSATDRVPIALELANVFQSQQRFHDGVLLLRPIAAELAAVGAPRPSWLRVEAEVLTHEFYDLASRPERPEHLRRLSREVRGDDPEEALLLVHLAMHEVNWGTAPRALELARAAWADGRLQRLVGSLSASLNLVASVHLYVDEPGWVLATADRWAAVSRNRGSPLTACFAEIYRAEALYRMGRLVDSLAAAEVAWTIASELGRAFPGWWVAISSLGQALLATGQAAAGRQLLETHGVLDGPPLEQMLLPLPRVVRPEALVATGEIDRGAAELIAAADWMLALEPSPGAWHFPATLVDALLALGRRDEARSTAAEWLRRTEAFGAKTTIGMAQRSMALTASGQEQIDGLRAAERTLSLSPCASEHARALVELGSSLRRAGSRTSAREPLRQGLDLATRCGAAGLAARARDELTASGARPRRTALTGIDALSPAERRVAQLAAQGLTNREVAAALFISRKTVEHHLGSIYTKLGTSDRSSLSTLVSLMAPAAAEQGV